MPYMYDTSSDSNPPQKNQVTNITVQKSVQSRVRITWHAMIQEQFLQCNILHSVTQFYVLKHRAL